MSELPLGLVRRPLSFRVPYTLEDEVRVGTQSHILDLATILS